MHSLPGDSRAPAAPSLLPVLVHIQTHLADDLSLETLAQLSGLSPFHFHRRFRELIGETAKQYTQRLRLEQAAYQLKMQPAQIVDIAFGTGYRSHETFARAFRRHFGVTPSAFRQRQRLQGRRLPREEVVLNSFQPAFSIGAPSFRRWQPITVAFIRHLGPYVDVDMTSFDRLLDWSQRRGLHQEDHLLIGVGHDDPTITPGSKLRFDACLQVAAPFNPVGEIGCQVIPGGYYAATTYIGPFGRTMEEAYGAVFTQLLAQTRFRIIGLPAIEIYRTTRINPDYVLNHTDILVPVEQK